MQIFKAHDGDPSGLGIVARHAETIRGQKNEKLLIPGRPDHYKVPEGAEAYYWSTFESDEIPQKWVDNLNEAVEVFVPHEYIRKAFIRSGVTRPVNVVNQGFTRYKRTKPLGRKEGEPLRIGILGVPTARKNVERLVKAVQAFNGKIHLDIHTPWLVAPEQKEWIKGGHVSLSIGRMSDEEVAEWYSNLDGYIYPSSGEGWSFTPREALYMGIPTIISDIAVHDELMPYVCPIKSDLYKPAYYEFLDDTCGQWKHYGEEDIMKALQNFIKKYDTYKALAQQASEWIAKKWEWETILTQLKNEVEPKHLLFCPSRYRHCGINTYTQELLPYLPETKYVNSYVQIDGMLARNDIESIHVQHEWGIVQTRQLIAESRKWECRKKITMHTVVPGDVMNQQQIVAHFNDVYALTRKGAQVMGGVYVPHGTAAPIINSGTAHTNIQRDSGTHHRIGTFGFIHPQKGYQYLIPAAERAGFSVKILGSLNKDNKRSVDIYNEYVHGKANIVHIDQYLSYEQVYKELSDCDLLVYYYESGRALYTSGSILHAARLGIPIICAQNGIFEDLQAGTYQVPEKDSDALCKAILDVSSNSEYQKRLVENMNQILNEHLWEKIAKRFQ